MENVETTSTLCEKSQKMTLKRYYKRLPEPTYPKKEFVNALAEKCNVTMATANNWIKYGIKPNNPEHVRIISEMTGILPEHLWDDWDECDKK